MVKQIEKPSRSLRNINSTELTRRSGDKDKSLRKKPSYTLENTKETKLVIKNDCESDQTQIIISPKAINTEAPVLEQKKIFLINKSASRRSLLNKGDEFPKSLEEISVKQWKFGLDLVIEQYFGKYIF